MGVGNIEHRRGGSYQISAHGAASWGDRSHIVSGGFHIFPVCTGDARI